jgi:hypothetical protein
VTKNPTPEERDDPVKLPLDPEEALRALLKVDPDSEATDDPSVADRSGDDPQPDP